MKKCWKFFGTPTETEPLFASEFSLEKQYRFIRTDWRVFLRMQISSEIYPIVQGCLWVPRGWDRYQNLTERPLKSTFNYFNLVFRLFNYVILIYTYILHSRLKENIIIIINSPGTQFAMIIILMEWFKLTKRGSNTQSEIFSCN